jgi:hypothetical protein
LQFSLQAASPETFGYTLVSYTFYEKKKIVCIKFQAYPFIQHEVASCVAGQRGTEKLVTRPVFESIKSAVKN